MLSRTTWDGTYYYFGFFLYDDLSLGIHETVLRSDFALYKLSFKPAPSSLDSLEKKPSVKLAFELYCYVSGYLALLSSSVFVDLPIVVVLRSYVKISGFMLR